MRLQRSRFVRSTGEEYPYPLLDVGLGNIERVSVRDLFSSETACQIRGGIGRSLGCRRCREPGLERYTLSDEVFADASLLLRMGAKKLSQLHDQMGLDTHRNRGSESLED